MNEFNDYWDFTRELKIRLNNVKALERLFFELDDICDNAIKNNLTLIDNDGYRRNAVDACFGNYQADTYKKLQKEIESLNTLLSENNGFFNRNNE